MNFPEMNPHVFYVRIDPVEIGRFSYVGEFSHVSQKTFIGKFCSISNLCTIGAQQHALDAYTTYPFEQLQSDAERHFKETRIGNDVWIGANSVVMAGVTVGDGAVIGAGSIVLHDVPAYAIVVGAPARVIRHRFTPEVIAALLSLRWWDLEPAQIEKLPFRDIDAAIAMMRKFRQENANAIEIPEAA